MERNIDPIALVDAFIPPSIRREVRPEILNVYKATMALRIKDYAKQYHEERMRELRNLHKKYEGNDTCTTRARL